MNPSVAVIGGGSWATATIKMLNDNAQSKNIFWWMRNSESIQHIQKFGHNPQYLSSVQLSIPAEHISDDLVWVISQAQFIVLNTPAAFLHHILSTLPKDIFKDKMVVSAIKGIVPETKSIVGEYLKSEFNVPYSNMMVIGGPCHAEEVALEKLSYLTIGAQCASDAQAFASLIQTRYIKTNLSDDIFGIEYGAVLKNIYAIASGICHGLGYGDNFQAVLIANAIQEMKRFVDAVHPITRDIKESAYLGDLLVTGYSQFSRNRTFGNMIGKGYTVTSAQLEMNMVAEGYYASKCMHLIYEAHQIEMPIAYAVHQILYEKKSPKIEIQNLANKIS